MSMENTDVILATPANKPVNPGYNIFLQFVAGLSGLLYGIDLGIIGGALPYLEATSGLTLSQLSIIVAAVLLGSLFSTLFAGILADALGRRPLMIVSGLMFVVSIPIISLSHGYGPLFFGRLLQGASAGVIGLVVPLYLAECLTASTRGRGTAIYQWMLTLGIVVAAFVGMYFSYRVAAVASTSSPAALFAFKNWAWRRIFWVSLPPGVFYFWGSFFLAESPRWLFRKGKKERALAALLRSRSSEQAAIEIEEMESTAGTKMREVTREASNNSLLRRKYVVPFLLACSILFCNQATGINSIIGYNANILIQSGLSDLQAHWGYVLFTSVNFLLTSIGVALVDRKGRRFLLVVGTGGAALSLVLAGVLFHCAERFAVDCRGPVQAMVGDHTNFTFQFSPAIADRLMKSQGYTEHTIQPSHSSLAIVYSCGDFSAATNYVRSDDLAAAPIVITRINCVPANAVEAFFKNPFGNLNAARSAPLHIEKAVIHRIPSPADGWRIALCLYFFVAFYATGPGVVVWLVLPELLPTRIRSKGMSIPLILNQMVSTSLASLFLPFVGRYGYSVLFFIFGAFTCLYFLIALVFLPETKGKTLEEIETHFEGDAARG